MSVQLIYQSALLKFGQAPENTRFSDDFYNAINDSQNDICTSRSWGFLRTSATVTATDSTRASSLPSDFGKAYDLAGAFRILTPSANAGAAIELMSYENWLSNEFEDGTSEGTPGFAYILGSSIYFSPIPDVDYTTSLIYYKIPTAIADTSTTITVPTQYEELLKKNIWRRLQDAGYSSVQELQISDTDISRLLGNMARDDVRRYGGFSMNLPNSDYKLRMV